MASRGLRVDSLPGWRVWPGVTRALRQFTLYKPVFNGQTTHPLKHTKIKVSPLTGLQMVFSVIPEMPSKTFVIGLKKTS